MAGSGTVTPITTTPGIGGSGCYGGTEPAPWTLLSLPRYARLMGLDPIHFMGGYSALRPASGCNSVWYQYDWQGAGQVSRQQLAFKISEAERDIADQLGYWPAPVWIEDERDRYPRPQRTDLYQTDGLNIRGRFKSMRLKWGYVVQGGQRATTLLSSARGSDIDTDGDGFYETAVFTVTEDADTEPCEVHAYFKEYSDRDLDNTRTEPDSCGADPPWEVAIESRVESGSTLTVYIKKWNMFCPPLWQELAPEPIDADDSDSYVDNLVFYRVYTDPETQVEFQWASDVSCNNDYAASYTTQNGAFLIRDRRNSIIVPEPATWDSSVDMFTKDTCWAELRDPDWARFWYLAGYRPERENVCELLDPWWAETIAMLATARLIMPLCDCAAARRKFDWWQIDLAEVGADRSWNIDVSRSEWGTRRGEVEAWKRVTKGRGRPKGQAILA